MASRVAVFGLSIVAMVLAGCLKKEQFPDVPKLEYIGTVLNQTPLSEADSIGFVRFRFTDGDGDLGLSPGDTLGQFAQGETYYHNLFVHYFEKQNGQYVEFVPVFPFHSRFKDLTPKGGDKSLQGQMDVGVFARPGSPFDTVRYEIYIVDRALNHSDTIVTEDIILPF
jgi:hypothetical protein